MFKAIVTVNLPDNKEVETEYTHLSLEGLWQWIETDFPEYTSLVLVITKLV